MSQKQQNQAHHIQLDKGARRTSRINTTASSFSNSSSSSSSTAAATATAATVPSSSVAYSTAAFTASSDWAGLPAELFVAITCFLPNYRFLLALCGVDRRLYRLVQESDVRARDAEMGAEVVGGSSSFVWNGSVALRRVWSSLPPVRCAVYTAYRDGGVEVDGVRVMRTRRGPVLHVPHMLHSLRHLSSFALTVTVDTSTRLISEPLQRAYLQPLQHFDQLTSFAVDLGHVELDERTQLPPLLVIALNSLPKLKCLELYGCQWLDSKSLWRTLRRLCREQLLHAGLSLGWLHRLAWQGAFAMSPTPQPPLPSVLSFRFTSPCGPYLESLSVFPSLTYFDIARHGSFNETSLVSSLRSLSSLRLRSSSNHHSEQLPQLHTLILCEARSSTWSGSNLIQQPRALRHFAATAGDEDISEPNNDLYKTLEQPFASLRYLQLDGALCAAHWQYLLTPATPPAFAATLTHLLLRCQSKHVRLATPLLPHLPLMYSALERCHIRLHAQARGVIVAEEQRDEWDAAVRTLRLELGAAWCVEAAYVVACRSDVVWRRKVNVQYAD